MLPYEIQLEILLYLDYEDIIKTGITDECLWKKLLERDFNNLSRFLDYPIIKKNYYEKYKYLYHSKPCVIIRNNTEFSGITLLLTKNETVADDLVKACD